MCLTRHPSCRRAADRVLLGLNFYGTDFNTVTGAVTHLTGAAFGELSDARGRRPKRTWDAAVAEHVSEYPGDDGAEHVVYYPSLRSIQARCTIVLIFAIGMSKVLSATPACIPPGALHGIFSGMQHTQQICTSMHLQVAQLQVPCLFLRGAHLWGVFAFAGQIAGQVVQSGLEHAAMLLGISLCCLYVSYHTSLQFKA